MVDGLERNLFHSLCIVAFPPILLHLDDVADEDCGVEVFNNELMLPCANLGREDVVPLYVEAVFFPLLPQRLTLIEWY